MGPDIYKRFSENLLSYYFIDFDHILDQSNLRPEKYINL